jgi:hypothetical protein
MRNYAVDEYGLLIDDAAIRYVARKLKKNNAEELDWDDIANAEEELGCYYTSEFDGEAFAILDDGRDDCDIDTRLLFEGNVLYLIPLRRYPTLFSTAYNNMQEVIAEVRQGIENLPPQNFDYRGHLRHVIGTYLG